MCSDEAGECMPMKLSEATDKIIIIIIKKLIVRHISTGLIGVYHTLKRECTYNLAIFTKITLK